MNDRVKTGITGFDELLGEGIEKGSVVLVSGGAGTGKTNFSCHYLYNGAVAGSRCLYISFEESVDQIKRHVARFGMDFERLEKSGRVKFVKIDVYHMAKALQAMFLKMKGELKIKEGLPEILPDNFTPDRIVVDSLSALSAVLDKVEYRYFLFQLFSHFKELGATTFAIAETKQEPTEYSRTGIEEFLADGVIALYNIKNKEERINAVEVLKLRGAKHEKRLAPFKITEKGIVVYPKQEVFA